MPKYYRSFDKFEIVTDEEIQQYVDAIPSKYHDEYSVFLPLAHISGMRITQIGNLKSDNISIDNVKKVVRATYLPLKHGNPGKNAYGFKDPFVKEYIMPFFDRLQDTPNLKLFIRKPKTHQRMMYDLNKKIYPDKKNRWLNYHYLRHSRFTFLTQVLGWDQWKLKSWTGHKSGAFDRYVQQQNIEEAAGNLAYNEEIKNKIISTNLDPAQSPIDQIPRKTD
jgi:integrase